MTAQENPPAAQESGEREPGSARPALHPGPGSERESRTLRRRWIRRLHAVAGLVLALNLGLLLVTGFLMQHPQAFGLEEKRVSRAWLPADYRPQDGGEVRADIVVADLHSGRLLGGPGRVLVDAVSVGWLVMLVSGVALFGQGHWRNNRNGNGEE